MMISLIQQNLIYLMSNNIYLLFYFFLQNIVFPKQKKKPIEYIIEWIRNAKWTEIARVYKAPNPAEELGEII